MSKAEKYIEENTKLYSNISADRTVTPWLTPDQARKAVEIAREEMVEKVTNYLNSKLYDWVQTTNPYQRSYANTIMKQVFIDDLKQAMKDE